MERLKKLSLRRPICEGKYKAGECIAKVVLQILPKNQYLQGAKHSRKHHSPMRRERARMSKRLRNSKHMMNMLLQQVFSYRLANDGRIGRGTRNKA